MSDYTWQVAVCQVLFCCFLKYLSDHAVNFRIAQKSNGQPMGQTHNLGAGITESPGDAVPIRTVGRGDCDFSVPNGDDVEAIFTGDGKLLFLS